MLIYPSEHGAGIRSNCLSLSIDRMRSAGGRCVLVCMYSEQGYSFWGDNEVNATD